MPDDDRLKLINCHNHSYSLRGNEVYKNKLNLIGLLLNTNLYRNVVVNVTNLRFTDFKDAQFSAVYFLGSSLVTLYYSDVIHSNFSAAAKFVMISAFGKVVMKS